MDAHFKKHKEIHVLQEEVIMMMNTKFARLSLTALLVVGLSLIFVAGVSAAVWTDQAD